MLTSFCELILRRADPHSPTGPHREYLQPSRACSATPARGVLRVQGRTDGVDAEYGVGVGWEGDHGEYGFTDGGVDGAGEEGVGRGDGERGFFEDDPCGEVCIARGGC